MNFKKLFVIVLLFVFSSFLISTRAEAAAVTGWAWSSNTGWLQFNTGSANPVTIATTSSTEGKFWGYAWSSNIGWVSFNITGGGCPIMPANGTCQGTINLATGAVTGWARACVGTVNKDCASPSRTDGWDGWIELSGVNHASPNQTGNGGVTMDTTNGDLKGFAFSQVIGWLQFDAQCLECLGGVVPPSALTATLVANPSGSTSVPMDSTLTATRDSSSTATGPITYEFKCKESDSWSAPPSISNTYSCSGSNAYTTVGTYTASARVSQGGSTAIPTATINAGNLAVGTCGPAARTYSSAETSYGGALCSVGGPTVSPAFPAEGQSVTWMCGTSLSNCTAIRESSTSGSEDGTLLITRPLPISSTKQIRANQSVDLEWTLPSTWVGCRVWSEIDPPNPTEVNGWTNLDVYSKNTTTLPRMRIGDYTLQINCNAGSSTDAVRIRVVDPNTGEI
jgi:hypothetical protein